MLGVGGASLCLACNSLVTWRNIAQSPQYQLPQAITIYVAVSPTVSAGDDGGNVLALVDGLESGLRGSGREVSVLAARADEKPPLPRIELQVQSSDGGDPTMRGAGELVGFFGLAGAVAQSATSVAGSSKVVVDVYVVPASGTTTFSARVAGMTFGNASDSGNVAGAQSAGNSIASRLLR